MSSVYRAHDRLLERDVALKVLHEQFMADGEQVERFRREARAVAQLSHPNIVTVIDRGEQDGRQYIVFEYVEGENLKALVGREGPLPEREAIELTLTIARALGFAHEQGLVHRDVKPQNVLLNETGTTKVTDFGIARSLDMQIDLTQTGTVMGTSDYIAPEQARGSRVDAQSDVYSLGAVLYELLTGEVPFRGDNFVAVAMQHINEPPPSVRDRRPELSACIDGVVRRAMAKEPRDRYRSMDEFCSELSGCLSGLEGAVSPGAETLVVAPQRRRKRRRARPPAERPSVWPLVLLLGGLAVLAGILAAVFTFTDATEKIRQAAGGKSNHSSTAGAPVPLSGVAAYDPFGDQHEHDEDVALATDGNTGTFWTTEHYQSFTKAGVGLVLDAGSAKKLSRLTVRSDTPGFTAEIQAGASPSGTFTKVSSPATASTSTDFTVDGQAARYYVIWITDLGGNDAVHVNEVTAKSG
jgi:eukaryotic-like serine/threonine-protein kinase